MCTKCQNLRKSHLQWRHVDQTPEQLHDYFTEAWTSSLKRPQGRLPQVEGTAWNQACSAKVQGTDRIKVQRYPRPEGGADVKLTGKVTVVNGTS